MDNYIKEIEEKIKNEDTFKEKDKENFKNKILYFQHERLIHLLVTLFYALFLIGFIFLSMSYIFFIIPCFGILIFLFFYVRHYFYLENMVQYMYTLYDKIF